MDVSCRYYGQGPHVWLRRYSSRSLRIAAATAIVQSSALSSQALLAQKSLFATGADMDILHLRKESQMKLM